jgi:hypothetical protein
MGIKGFEAVCVLMDRVRLFTRYALSTTNGYTLSQRVRELLTPRPGEAAGTGTSTDQTST